MTVVAYGVDHGFERVLNVVKGYGKPPTPPLLLPKSAQMGLPTAIPGLSCGSQYQL